VEIPVKHLQTVMENKLLSGLMFSGTAVADNLYGSWQDNHMPFARAFGIESYESNSLLTSDNILKALQVIEAESIDYMGIKLLGMPIENCSVSRRVGINRDALRVLEKLQAQGL